MIKLFSIVVFLFSFFLSPAVFSQNIFDKVFTRSEPSIGFPVFVPPVAPQTMLSEKKRDVTVGFVKDAYYYFSDLSADEIAGFYDSVFSEKGLRFVSQHMIAGYTSYIYKRGAVTQAALTISERYPDHYGENANKTHYTIFWQEAYNAFILPESAIRVKPREDVAIYPRAYELRDKGAPDYDTMTYLTKSDPELVIAYYKDHMGEFGWRHESEFPIKGRYNIYEAAMHQTDISEVFASYGISMSAIYPGVDATLRGSTLVYSKGENKCHVIIYQLKDSSKQLEQARINPAPFEKYGRTLIMTSIVTSPDKMVREQNLSVLKKTIDEAFGFDESDTRSVPDAKVQYEGDVQPDSNIQPSITEQFEFGPDVEFIPSDAKFIIPSQE
jgi:hypothetical protein